MFLFVLEFFVFSQSAAKAAKHAKKQRDDGQLSGKQGLWQSLFKIFWFVWQTAKSRQYLSNFLFVFSGTGSSLAPLSL
jgi:hypothetical protein